MLSHIKELVGLGVAVTTGVILYRKLKAGPAPTPSPTPVPPGPQPSPPPDPGPPPVNYGTITGPNPGDTNGLVSYNPAATVTSSGVGIGTDNASGDEVVYNPGSSSDSSADDSSYLDDASNAVDALTGLISA